MGPLYASRRSASIEYAIRDIVVPATELERKGHELIKLNIGDPLSYPGLPTPPHMVEAFKGALENQRNGYGPSYGIEELRVAIANDEVSKGWGCEPKDVYVTHGVTEALQVLFAAFLEEGDTVLAPGPHYPPYMAYPQMYCATTVEYALDSDDGWAINVQDIREKMDESVRFIVIVNPNNPTGNVAKPSTIREVLGIASEWPNRTIIADEIYDALDFSGDQTSIASQSTDVPVVTLNGVSKVHFAPGWRIGYMAFHDPMGRLIGPRDGVERILRSRLCASTPAQHGYIAGLNHDRSWLKERLVEIKSRVDLCMERIDGIDGISCQRPGGAFYLFPRIDEPSKFGNDKDFVLDLLHQEHVLVVHGSGFSPKYGSGHFRMVALAPEDILSEAFDRIDRFVRSR